MADWGAPVEVDSPAAALKQQAAEQYRVDQALHRALRYFLGDVYEMCMSASRVSVAQIDAAWHTRFAPDALALPEGRAAYVSASVFPSTIPDDVYSSSLAVYIRSDEQRWNRRDMKAAFKAAFVPTSSMTVLKPIEGLTAAAPVVKKGPDGKPIYRRTAGLDQVGMSWGARMSAEAKTAVTGLWALLAQEQMIRDGDEWKRWVTRRDSRVREAHADVDGQTVPVNEHFIVGGFPMMHPGDRSAPVELVINCRCVMVAADDPRPPSKSSGGINRDWIATGPQ